MKTMLIVDDSAFARSLLKIVIDDLDIKVVGEADNGITGVEMYKELMPDITALDYAMDGGNGISALEDILQHNPNAVVIIISSIAGQTQVINEATALGAKGVFIKPINKKQFTDGINKIISEMGV